jgi:hypothetical protein
MQPRDERSARMDWPGPRARGTGSSLERFALVGGALVVFALAVAWAGAGELCMRSQRSAAYGSGQQCIIGHRSASGAMSGCRHGKPGPLVVR